MTEIIKRYQVFVSSTYEDLIDERRIAAQALLETECIPTGMELFPASSKKQWEIIKQIIEDSDYFLLIIGGRYGSLGENELGQKVGFTEMEFDYAVSIGKPIIAFIHRDPNKRASAKSEKSNPGRNKLKKFCNKVKKDRIISYWTNCDNLRAEIVTSVKSLINECPGGGWIKQCSGIVTTDKLFHVDEMEIREREFCSKSASDAQITIITNNLTCDYNKFLDEIVHNLENGVSYTYIVPKQLEKSTKEIRKAALSKASSTESHICRFEIKVNSSLFMICPKKYTVAIYDRGHIANIDSDALKVFCCAQDTDDIESLYYFEMSYDSAKAYKQRIDNVFLAKTLAK